jgi:hypothetical protein
MQDAQAAMAHPMPIQEPTDWDQQQAQRNEGRQTKVNH